MAYYVFFNLDKSFHQEEGKERIKNVFAIKTNQDFTILSKFDFPIDEQRYQDSLREMYAQFELWVRKPYETKFISFDQEDEKFFLKECQLLGYQSQMKDFYRVIHYQYWNIRHEMTYRLGISTEKVGIEDLLDIYGLSFVGNKDSAKDVCFNTLSLVVHFKKDVKRNQEVFVPYGRGKAQEHVIPLLNLKRRSGEGEKKLIEKMAEGWNISIECKAKGRGYGMTFEGVAYPTDVPIEKRWSSMRFGTGNTLEELMSNLFDKWEEGNPSGEEIKKKYESIQRMINP